MAATIIITSATASGDLVTVQGTVNGVPATCQLWLSYLQLLPDKPSRLSYVATLLKAAALPPTPSPVDILGTTTI